MGDPKSNRPPFRVNPVFAVIIMVAITMVLAATLYVWAESGCDGPYAPVAAVTIDNSTGNYTVRILDIDPEPDIEDVGYVLLNTNWISRESGDVLDIVNGNLSSNTVIYFDNDNNSKLSINDTFFILSYENGGLAKEEFTFRLIHHPTDGAMVSVELP